MSAVLTESSQAKPSEVEPLLEPGREDSNAEAEGGSAVGEASEPAADGTKDDSQMDLDATKDSEADLDGVKESESRSQISASLSTAWSPVRRPIGRTHDGIQIICVGLMRTGLKSLHKALRKLGYSRIFDQEQIVQTYELWDDVMRNRFTEDTFVNIFQGAQVAMGMPTFCFWEHILQLYPKARVILTVRDEHEWFRSLERAKSLMDKDLPGAPLCHGSLMRVFERVLVPSYHRFCEVMRFAWSVTLGGLPMRGENLNETIVRASFRKHNTYVQALLKDRVTPEGKQQLLVYDVHDGWGPLCEFLGIDEPEEAFPAVTEVPYFPGQPMSQGVNSKPMDIGQEFENFLVPESEFGIRTRQELRKGLALALLVLAMVVAPVIAAIHSTSFIKYFIALVYMVLLAVFWEVYVVTHTVVMRVPALVVLPMVMKSLLIALCLQACFITYGILKEQLVTQDHINSTVLILSARVMSVVCGSIALLATDGRIGFSGTPITAFLAFGFTNEASTWAGYEMLKYLSFPVQVMAKSCKLLPVMIMGKALNGTSYQWYQYAQAVSALICVTVMHLTEEQGHEKKGAAGGASSSGAAEQVWNALLGLFFLVVFFTCDSFTSQWQTALYKKHSELSKTQMMLAGNIMGLAITLVSVVGRWSAVMESLGRAVTDPMVAGRIVLLGFSGAMGSFCIYTAIKVLGPLAFTWIMTTRQLLSVLISLVMFGHGVSVTKLLCILTVFAIMSSKQLAQVGPVIRKCGKCKARGRSHHREQPNGQGVNGKAAGESKKMQFVTRLPSANLKHRASQVWADSDMSRPSPTESDR